MKYQLSRTVAKVRTSTHRKCIDTCTVGHPGELQSWCVNQHNDKLQKLKGQMSRSNDDPTDERHVETAEKETAVHHVGHVIVVNCGYVTRVDGDI